MTTGFDPGTFGCQHYEASQFMFQQRRIDPSAYLILASRRCRRPLAGPVRHQPGLSAPAGRAAGPGHELIAYEAATLPITTSRMGKMPLSDLVNADLRLQTTLVIRPAGRCNATRPCWSVSLNWTGMSTSVALQHHQHVQGSQFLEAAGRNATLAPVDYAAAVAALDVDEAQRQALLARDHAGLNQLLDGRTKMIFMVSAPLEDDQPESMPDDADGVPVPEQDEPEPSRQ